jgi:hypothetical protein
MRRKYLLWAVVVASLAAGGTLRGEGGKDTSEDVLKKIQGTWKFVAQEMDGKALPKEEMAKQTITFDGDKWTVHRDGKVVLGRDA